MSTIWQNLIVAGIVVISGLYIAQRVWRSLARKKSGGCGGCGTCSSGTDKGEATGRVLVTLQPPKDGIR